MPAHRAADPTYVMGHSEQERERLMRQAGLYAPISERFLRTAGIAPGMRVLDVGCGVGDVALLCADLVGSSGEIVGIDRDPAALARGRERIASAGVRHARLLEGDYRELPVTELFDAVVGRFVLMYAADPSEAIRSPLPHLRPGGIVAFQELDFTDVLSWPRGALFDRIVNWWRASAGQAGIELHMGLKLYPTYLAAGLPAPHLQGDMLLGGGADFAGYAYLAGIVRSILPMLERYGIATAAEVDVETLADRLRDETVASQGVISLALAVGASSRKAT